MPRHEEKYNKKDTSTPYKDYTRAELEQMYQEASGRGDWNAMEQIQQALNNAKK